VGRRVCTGTLDGHGTHHRLVPSRGSAPTPNATNLYPEHRKVWLRLARELHVLPVAIAFDLPVSLSVARNAMRPDRDFGRNVLRRQHGALRRSLRGLKREGFRQVVRLDSEEAVEAISFRRVPMWPDRRTLTGPFDIIGDVHGCADELEALLRTLGWQLHTTTPEATTDDGLRVLPRIRAEHPEGRTAVFLGDLVDRGPDSPRALSLAMDMVEDGVALMVPGNHEVKFEKWLAGRNVKLTHGLDATVAQTEACDPTFRERARPFIRSLVSHAVLDDGKLVVAHAGMRADMAGRASGRVRQFALYGDTTGEVDAFGLPVRLPWARDYAGEAAVVYGHTPTRTATWANNTLCIDTGCVFGGALTALQWPERTLVSVPAARQYSEPAKPLDAPEATPDPGVLSLPDVTGRTVLHTPWLPAVSIGEAYAAAALEAMSRFTADPRWLVYLPPTMSPTETSPLDDFLEHPTEAFAYFRDRGVDTVVCQEKHMGSRAVVVLCRDEAAGQERFWGATGGGAVLTRTGRRFFSAPLPGYDTASAVEAAFLARLRTAATACDLWARFDTDFVVLDCELMPWSAKAQSLLQTQYAPVGAAGLAGLGAAEQALAAAVARGVAVDDLLTNVQHRHRHLAAYDRAWRPYCWPVPSLDALRLAPFHLLATAGGVHHDRPHSWHLAELARLCATDRPWLHPTTAHTVDLHNATACANATSWWLERTAAGAEGMVVKPLDFVARHGDRVLQPALKVRGREYLRIIYGPEYTHPTHLQRLKKRAVRKKRSMALREFSVGLEGLRRFVAGEPLAAVHACAFGVLALESEPVDPRL
jgi:protein phosphatase